MTDFYQTGIITTLHNLGKSSFDRLEQELSDYARTRPIALVCQRFILSSMARPCRGSLRNSRK